MTGALDAVERTAVAADRADQSTGMPRTPVAVERAATSAGRTDRSVA
jgi:hypothetical protein